MPYYGADPDRANCPLAVNAVKHCVLCVQFHQALEAQHAAHTMDELEEAYAAGRITDEAKFEAAANAMLDACAVFWEGLDAARRGEEYEADETASILGI